MNATTGARRTKKQILGDPKQRPAKVIPIYDNLPQSLKNSPRWINWQWKFNPDRGIWDKPPMTPHNGSPGGWQKSESWGTLLQAAEGIRKYDASGIGYVMQVDDRSLVAIDLDDCVDAATGEIFDWPERPKRWKNPQSPRQIMAAIGSYWEISASGTGLRGFLFCPGVDAGRLGNKGGAEFYVERKYLTVTGRRIDPMNGELACGSCEIATVDASVLNGILAEFGDSKAEKAKMATDIRMEQRAVSIAGCTPTADQVIKDARAARNAEKFCKLFDGDISEYSGDHSRADAAFCCMVAFYAGHNKQVIDEIFRLSKLIRPKWDEVHGNDGRTYGEMTIDFAIRNRTELCKSSGFRAAQTIGGVTLVPKGVRKTPTKVSVTLEIQRDDKAVDLFTLASSIAGREKAAKAIQAHVGEGMKREIDAALGRILVEATADKGDSGLELKDVHEILAEYIPEQINLKYREDSKAYSESLDQLINRSQFIERFTSNTVLQLVATAGDAPVDENEVVDRQRLIIVVEKELRVLWGELLSKLPDLADAEIKIDSKTAQQFHQAIVSLWSRPKNMGIYKQMLGEASGQNGKGNGNRDSVQLATVVSLASRVRRMGAAGQIPSDKWVAVQDGYDAFCRMECGPAPGEIQIRLAMRYVLTQQVGVTIPGVNDQGSLTKLAKKFGAAEESQPGGVSDRMSGGARLTLLSLAVTGAILATPTNEMNSASDNDESVTGVTDEGSNDGDEPASDTSDAEFAGNTSK